ncbi:hypothetical protein CA13_12700 [Planctomycetes bacterium CA13]|uniref:PSP1 C-terminal domain-containing protein n=1 Tax=Novipirellula herctigrandis TaxID=2527986 RepID=A0A5C5YZK4_9BACT|nr:hypothetical protein CA13_12700 [Planctomycetes bacterium CA13]
MGLYLVRIGSLGSLFVAKDANLSHMTLPRGTRVITRTARGVELAEVVSAFSDESSPLAGVPQAEILRPTTEQDELLIRRLDRHRREAVEACREELARAGSSAVLLDVDQLFDGGTLVMHFLGEIDPLAESITKQITEQYEQVARTRHFAKLLRDGCGPDCGTVAGMGCGTTGGCVGCAGTTKCFNGNTQP